jgi:hypothetical protein
VSGTGSGSGAGVYGESSGVSGVEGVGLTAGTRGVSGTGNDTGVGVYGESSGASGVEGTTTSIVVNTAGVFGLHGLASGIGVLGKNDVSGGFGVSGKSDNGEAVYGVSTAGVGVHGETRDLIAVKAESTGTGNAIQATSASGYAVMAYGNTTRAPLHLEPQSSPPSTRNLGDMYVNAAGNFKIWDGATWRTVQII